MARHHYETLQQVFDDAYRGLAAQGFEQSLRDHALGSEMCAYRGIDGHRCAIGHCIPDDLYSPILEGAVVNPKAKSRLEAERVFHALFAGINLDDLGELQSHHDCWKVPEDMKNALQNWARGKGLTIPSVEGAA